MNKKLLEIIAMVVAPFCFAMIAHSQVYATADFNTIRAKAALEGVYQCFTNGDLHNNVGSPYSGGWTYDGSWAIRTKGNNKFFRQKGANDAVKLPYGMTDATDNNADCGQVLFGFNTNLSASALQTAQNNGANITDDKLNEGLIPSTVQASYSVSEVKEYFAGSSGNGGSGSMNYKATAEDTATSGNTYSQLTLKFEANEYSQCLTDAGMPAASNAMTRVDGNGNTTTVPGIIFPAVTKTADGKGSVVVDGVDYNVPAPGAFDSYYYRLCGVEFRVESIPDNKEVEYQIVSVNFMMLHSASTKKGVWDSYPDPLSDVHTISNGNQVPVWLVPTVTEGSVSDSSAANTARKYTFNWDSDGNVMYAIKKLSDTNTIGYKVTSLTTNYSSLELTNQEIFDLYKYYLKNVFKVPVSCEGEANYEGISNDSSSKLVKWASGKACYAYLGYSSIQRPSNVYGVKTGVQRLGGVDVPAITDKHFKYLITLEDVIDALNVLPITTLDNSDDGGTADEIAGPGGTPGDNNPGGSNGSNGGQNEDEEGDPCYAAGLEGMSWLMCPAINNMANTSDGIDAALETMLSVDTRLYDTLADNGGESGTYKAWKYFRDVANVFLIIVFLVIIVSQLTGYGIDNYGIKKMLPRLIAMAILINLSYIICQLAIDLSNVLGVGLSNLLKGIGNEVYGGYSVGRFIMQVVGAIFAALAAGGAAAGVIISVAGVITGGAGPMIVVSLALTLLVALVAILFFFITLGARTVIIIIFTAISPLAFACYILPNTQSLFKKWWTAMKAALLVYPICGALYGLSFIIRGLIFPENANGVHFWMALIAVFAPFLPFFVMPNLLRGAISAIGQVGGMLAGLGTGMRRGISGANQRLRTTELYKSDAEMQRRRSTANKAFTNKDGTFRSTQGMSRWQRLWRGGDRGIARARAQYVSDVKTGGIEQNLMGVGAEARLNSAIEDVQNDTFKSYQNLFAGRSKDDLLGEAGFDITAPVSGTGARAMAAGGLSWYTGDNDSTQRMRALIGAMEANGMQKDIYRMLGHLDGQDGRANIGENTRVMQTLANGSKDKVLKAYGKKGGGMSYNDFMTREVRDGDGRVVASSAMQQYVREKGSDFLDGVDDKALSEIRRASSGSNEIMSTALLTEAAAKINSQDAVDEIDKMLDTRSDVSFSGQQLASFNESTVEHLADRAVAGDASVREAMVKASDNVANDSTLMNKLSGQKMQHINRVRGAGNELRYGGQRREEARPIITPATEGGIK